MKLLYTRRDSDSDMSHPVRVRGLKQKEQEYYDDGNLSHPVRVRGLKQTFVDLVL